MATDKRARKKDHRDAVLARRQALLRRRRIARLGAVLTAMVLIAAVAVVAGGGSDDEPRRQNEPAAEPPAESAEPTDSATPEPAPVACGAEAPPAADPQTYPEAEQVLQDGVDYRAVMETSCGTIEIDLLEDEAPVTVNNFVFLAQEGFYDGLTFHRVEKEFVVQGGDPEGTGAGGPGYAFEDELWMKSKDYKFGTLSMANSGPNTNGSQFFFIVHKPVEQPAGLAPSYSMFGRAAKSTWSTLDKIRKVEVSGSTPLSTVYIESVEIVEGGAR